MKKTIITFIVFIAILIFQISFLENFSFPLLRFNCVLVAFLLMLNILSFNKVMVLAVVCGFVADIFSSLPFGTFLVTYALTLFTIEILFLNFFTNHSFYSLIIVGLIAFVMYNFVFLGVSGILYFLNIGNFMFSPKYWTDLVWQLVDSSLLLAICFYLINNRSKLFKPVFLRS